ncbi:MAG: single-stranded DNA-binding protein [Ruminococcaceae bacterium]|nr:single-stranded DNA-binding protein [Oscillospiraceae bacterium]
MEHTNTITLIGCPYGRAEYSHSNHGRHFFSFYLQVERLSGAVDTLPILIPESLLASTELTEADALRITGQIRSYNNRSAVGRRLIISVLADSLELCNEAHENEVHLQGVICKEPCYRKTPLGREICDIMLAVNRPYHKADYLPCILWGRTAQEAAYYNVGTELRLFGRMQSRNYMKLLGDSAEQRTAYEISCISAESVAE